MAFGHNINHSMNSQTSTQTRTPLRPDKLLLSKWSAVVPSNKEKHFLVIKIIDPPEPGQPVTHVALEAVYTKRVVTLAWRELEDASVWLRGWK